MAKDNQMLFTIKTAENDQYGPVALETLRAWAREGRISKTDLVYDHTLLQWIEAPKLSQIMAFFSQAQPPAILNSKNGQDSHTGDAHSNKSSEANKTIEQHPKLTREKLMASQASNNGSNPLHPTRPSSVLERLGQVILKPFSKKKAGHAKADPKKKL